MQVRPALAVVLFALVLCLAAVWTVGAKTGMVDDEWADGWNIKIGELYYAHSDSPREREAFALRNALAYIRQQPIDYPLRKLARIVPELLVARHDTAYFLRANRFGPMSPSLAAALVRIENAAYVALMSFVRSGSPRPRDPRRTLVGLLGASVVIAHVITFALPRYRIPLLPFLALFAGVALSRPRDVWAPTRTRVLTAGVTVAAFLAIVVRGGL
jgi:hypothetical protein